MVQRFAFMMLLAGIACGVTAIQADDEKKPAKEKAAAKAESKQEASKKDEGGKKEEAKFTAKCPVSGEDASKDQAAKYKEKDVYFCCEKCKAAFEADSKKYAEKANHQLVQTKQFRQTKCPLSGGKTVKEQSVKVSDVKVTFCCEKCKGAMEAASKEEQLTKIFAEDVFAKSFEPRKADEGKGKAKGKKKDSEAKSN